jgi:D-xylose 1-dehydrogenase
MTELATGTARYPSLQDRVVFVTGGASGIGGDIVRAFAAQGAKVGFIDNDEAAARQLLASIDAVVQPLFSFGDVSRPVVLRGAIAATRAAFGDIGVLVNNVANDRRHDLEAVDEAFFDATVGVNLKPAFFAAQEVVADMRRRGGGAIVNLGSTSWKVKTLKLALYATCKSAMTGLTRNLARELGPSSIRVNLVSPGWVMTDKQRRLWVDAEGEREMDRNQCLPGRIAGADIAQMVLFLAADDSRMITAQEFVVDAGWT